MTRTIDVPEGFKAILVSDQLLEKYSDWTPIERCEARVTSTDGGPVDRDELLVDVQTRYL